MISCGSNAFGQLNHATGQGLGGLGGDLMSSLLKATILPVPLDGTLKVEDLSCGMNLSAAIVCHESDLGLDYRKTICYVWGAGLPGPPLRVPTPLSIRDVRQISCGHTHCGLVTESGMAFTWGSGDHGMLGHGDKHPVLTPKVVAALVKLKVLSISCGAYHTGIIVCEPGDLHTRWIRLSSGFSNGGSSSSKSHSRRSGDEGGNEHALKCGNLYTCGMNKVGQLGHGGTGSASSSNVSKNSSRNFVAIPKRVTYFDGRGSGEEGPLLVAKVSCGMHHTLMLCVPFDESRAVGNAPQTLVYSCGWGEHGRLGTGDEEIRTIPTKIEFTMPNTSDQSFCAIEIAAGEQHSLAAGREGAYSWGSNSMGQLGIGSPVTSEIALVPLRIPLPEGMEVKQLAAGGRHSAAITRCGKLLSWGWGEEGQLGGGNEKNAVYPRPVRIPKLRNESHKGVPVAVAVGMSHTVVILKNEEHIPPPPRPLSAIVEIVEPPPTPPMLVLIPKIEEIVLEPVIDPLPVLELEPEPQPLPKTKKSGMLFDGDEDTGTMDSAVRSIRQLLQQREGLSRPHSAEDGFSSEPAAEEEEVEPEVPIETSFAFFLTEQED